jgi:hypothetical protein
MVSFHLAFPPKSYTHFSSPPCLVWDPYSPICVEKWEIVFKIFGLWVEIRNLEHPKHEPSGNYSISVSCTVYILSVIYVYLRFSTENTYRWTVGWWMDSELEMNRDTIPGFAWRDWGKPRNISVRILSVPAEIGTAYLQSTGVDLYFYTSASQTSGNRGPLHGRLAHARTTQLS